MNNHTEDKSDFAKKAEMLSHASVEEFQTPTWNAAIQSCIDVVKEHFNVGDFRSNYPEANATKSKIISKLNNLKK